MVGYDNIDAIKPMLKGWLRAGDRRSALYQAVGGIETALVGQKRAVENLKDGKGHRPPVELVINK